MNDIWQAYREGAAAISTFFTKRPDDLYLMNPTPRALDPLLVDEINQYQEQIGSTGRLGTTDIIVATGQQPGLFTGPLYTLYKGLTAIKLAEDLASRWAVPVRTVFWVASSDHDIDESGVAHFLTRRHELLSLDYPDKEKVRGMPLSKVPIVPGLRDVVRIASEETPGCEGKEDVLSFLYGTLDESHSLAEWSTRLLARLFRGFPIVFLEPSLPGIRRIAASVFRKELEDPIRLSLLVNEAGKSLQELGFPPQIKKASNDCSFFVEIENRRRKVVVEQGRFVFPETGEAISAATLTHWLEENPERFSENVILRPISQQVLLEPVAYVAGPGEVGYWAQLRGVFEHYGLDMPVVYPRIRATLVTTKNRKLMERYGLALDDLFEPFETLLDRALEQSSRSRSRSAFQTEKEALLDAVARFCHATEQLSGELGPMASALRERVKNALERMEKTVLRADQSEVVTVKKHLTRLIVSLAPSRKPQERIYNPFSFLFEQGWGLIQKLFKELPLAPFEHKEVEL